MSSGAPLAALPVAGVPDAVAQGHALLDHAAYKGHLAAFRNQLVRRAFADLSHPYAQTDQAQAFREGAAQNARAYLGACDEPCWALRPFAPDGEPSPPGCCRRAGCTLQRRRPGLAATAALARRSRRIHARPRWRPPSRSRQRSSVRTPATARRCLASRYTTEWAGSISPGALPPWCTHGHTPYRWPRSARRGSGGRPAAGKCTTHPSHCRVTTTSPNTARGLMCMPETLPACPRGAYMSMPCSGVPSSADGRASRAKSSIHST